MLCRDETDLLDACLESCKGVFDEIVVGWTGSTVDTKRILKKHGCKIVDLKEALDPETGLMRDFSQARNFVAKQTENELAFWIDADDTLENPHAVRAWIPAFESNPELGAVWGFYYYDHDEQGRCIMSLPRERIVRKAFYEWQGALHETQIKKRKCHDVFSWRETNVFAVKHHATKDKIRDSAYRNIAISKAAYEVEHAEKRVDPRTCWNYARALAAVGQNDEALPILKEYVGISGWDDELYYALVRMAAIHRMKGRITDAFEADSRAMSLRPRWPDAYLGYAAAYFYLQRYDECMHMIRLAEQCAPPLGQMPVNPLDYEARPLLMVHQCLIHTLPDAKDPIAQIDKAIGVIETAIEYFPAVDSLKEQRDGYKAIKKQLSREEAFVRYAIDLESEGKTEQLKALLQAIHPDDADNPLIVRLRNRTNAGGSAKNRVVIMCGQTHEYWSPRRVATGIGGSEEAVIYMGQKLAALGWNVDVFGWPGKGEEGIYDGVNYRPFYEFDPAQPCAVYIAWRNMDMVQYAPKGSATLAWLHDVQKADFWSPALVEKYDRIMVLSEWHKGNLLEAAPYIADDKIWVTRNGIMPEQFLLDHQPRDTNKVIFASSPDRGLACLLEMWDRIKGKNPHASLDVFYGFTKTYDYLRKSDDRYRRYKELTLEDMKAKGVNFIGMVGHQELASRMVGAGVWAYPTQFLEISCITGMKTQAAGLVPVQTGVAALGETVFAGRKIDVEDIYENEEAQDRFVDAVVEATNVPAHDEARYQCSTEAKRRYDWGTLAEEWSATFRQLVDAKAQGGK